MRERAGTLRRHNRSIFLCSLAESFFDGIPWAEIRVRARDLVKARVGVRVRVRVRGIGVGLGPEMGVSVTLL